MKSPVSARGFFRQEKAALAIVAVCGTGTNQIASPWRTVEHLPLAVCPDTVIFAPFLRQNNNATAM